MVLTFAGHFMKFAPCGSNDHDNNVTGDKNEHENTQKNRKRYDESERPAKHEEKVSKKNYIKGVLNVPCTPGGIFAKRMRTGEEEIRGPTGNVVKIVEEAGDKVIDQLHKSNPWRGDDCARVGCLHCLTNAAKKKEHYLRDMLEKL